MKAPGSPSTPRRRTAALARPPCGEAVRLVVVPRSGAFTPTTFHFTAHGCAHQTNQPTCS